jgi:hypothetical protein
MRGRNRKGPNPLSRSFESNGPDVKIRGTAAHVAEKYLTLARDAGSAGDRVAEQNYLQHAEHYFRIVAAAQAQMPQPQPNQRYDGDGDDGDEPYDRRMQPNMDSRGGGGSDSQPYYNGGNSGNGHGGGRQDMDDESDGDDNAPDNAPQQASQRNNNRRPQRDRGPRPEPRASVEEDASPVPSED